MPRALRRIAALGVAWLLAAGGWSAVAAVLDVFQSVQEGALPVLHRLGRSKGNVVTYALDLETHLIAPGNPAPQMVCGSWACLDHLADTKTDLVIGGIFSREETLQRAEEWLRLAAQGELTLVGANFVFDLGVLAAEAPRLMPLIFEALAKGTLKDVHTRMALIDIARGCLYKNEDGSPLRDPETNKVKDRYSLSIISKILRGVTVQKADTWRLRYGELDGVPLDQWPAEAKEYPIKDATETLEDYLVQEGGPNLSEETRVNQANWALHLMRMRGIRTDPERVPVVAAEIRKRHAESRRKFILEGIVSVRGAKGGAKPEVPDEIHEAELREWRAAMAAKGYPTDAMDKALKRLSAGKTLKFCEDRKRLQYLMTEAYLGQPPLTDGGEVSWSRDAMKESGEGILEEYALTGEDETLYKTFLKPLEMGTVIPINPEWNVLVVTGRTSCRYPNLQNLPRGLDAASLAARVRECFIPRPGYYFCSVDYGAIEMVTLAQNCLWLFGYSRLAEALRTGQKPHELLAARLLGISYEEMLARYKAGDPVAKVYRQFAKIGNFGLAGGMGPDKLVRSARDQKVKFCVERGAAKCGVNKELDRQGKPICSECRAIAREVRVAYLQQWEEMNDYFALVSAETEGGDGGETEGGDGGNIQVLPDGLVVGKRGYTDAANLKFQGLAARLAKAALWDVTRECYDAPLSPLYGSRPVLFVHDEIIAEVPVKRAHAAANRLSELMLASLKRHCPDVPGEAKPALARRWYKAMEPAFNEDKELIPWEPRVREAA